jgi:hypothetical protein
VAIATWESVHWLFALKTPFDPITGNQLQTPSGEHWINCETSGDPFMSVLPTLKP